MNMQTLLDYVEKNAAEIPQKTWLRDRSGDQFTEWNWSDANSEINAVAAWLEQRYGPSKTNIVLLSRNRAQLPRHSTYSILLTPGCLSLARRTTGMPCKAYCPTGLKSSPCLAFRSNHRIPLGRTSSASAAVSNPNLRESQTILFPSFSRPAQRACQRASCRLMSP